MRDAQMDGSDLSCDSDPACLSPSASFASLSRQQGRISAGHSASRTDTVTPPAQGEGGSAERGSCVPQDRAHGRSEEKADGEGEQAKACGISLWQRVIPQRQVRAACQTLRGSASFREGFHGRGSLHHVPTVTRSDPHHVPAMT